MTNINDFEEEEQDGYLKIDQYNERRVERIAEHYVDILDALGEDSSRHGLQKTPQRVAKA